MISKRRSKVFEIILIFDYSFWKMNQNDRICFEKKTINIPENSGKRSKSCKNWRNRKFFKIQIIFHFVNET